MKLNLAESSVFHQEAYCFPFGDGRQRDRDTNELICGMYDKMSTFTEIT